MLRQTEQALQEADLVLLLADAREGLCTSDREIAAGLRAAGRPWLLVVNKAESMDPALVMAEFSPLGAAPVPPVSAAHGLGMDALRDAICAALPEPEPEAEAGQSPDRRPHGIRVAIAGRPNTGKSTLVNRLLGAERVVVSEEPGATRDSVEAPCTWGGHAYVLVDTAGVRRRRSLHGAVEKFSVMMTLRSIRNADVAVLLMDAKEGLTDQDLHLLGLILEAGRAAVFCINKWDCADEQSRQCIRTELERRLRFADYIRQVPISALAGSGLETLRRAVDAARAAATRSLGTGPLNSMLRDALRRHPPPRSGRRQIKLALCASGRQQPAAHHHSRQQCRAYPCQLSPLLGEFFSGAVSTSRARRCA